MDKSEPTVLQVMKQRLRWLSERQAILSQNVANANTPGFRPSDLKPFTFRQALGLEQAQLRTAVTQPGHLQGTRSRDQKVGAQQPDRNVYETTPDGNQVVTEQQMLKVADTGTNYQLVTSLYRRQMSLMRAVIGRTN